MTTHLKNSPARLPRLRLVLLAGLLAAIAGTLPLAVRADEPVRSGTIVSGTGGTGGTPGWGMEGCAGAPTCRAWLATGCDVRLAGEDPATMSAIVDIGDLVGASPARILDVTDGVGLNWGQFRVQFWTGTGSGQRSCDELGTGALHSLECESVDGKHSHRRCALLMPRDAKWMTITSTPDNTNIHWTLR